MDTYLNGQTGWICPKCGKVHAPWVSECNCNGTTTVTSNSCPHSWQSIGQSTAGSIYRCELCGMVKTEPFINPGGTNNG